MRISIISDTHGKHEELGVLEGDVLLHCGDFLDVATKNTDELDSVDAWFGRQRFERIYCVGGNHDFAVETRIACGEPVFENATWLQDQADVYRGVTFYGAPWIPQLEGWAFYLDDAGLRKKWARIPTDTDVLLSHTPPQGILDLPSSRSRELGCGHLRDRVERVQPRLHAFGHVHASAGVETHGTTTFVNATVVSSGLEVVRGPVEFDL